MSENISQKTIVILVILTVVISLLGTWTVVNEVNKIELNQPKDFNPQQTSAEIKLTIVEPPMPDESKTTGMVVFSKIE